MEALGAILIVVGIALIIATYTESTGQILEALLSE